MTFSATAITAFDNADAAASATGLAGGTNGQSYKITARLGTAGGREKEADILVQVAET